MRSEFPSSTLWSHFWCLLGNRCGGVGLRALIVGLLVFNLRVSTRAQNAPVVDASTMNGKVMCGYQGWFNTPNDGSGRGWVHWGHAPLGDGDFTVDLLPDVSELGSDELCDTSLKLPDGSPLRLYSAYNAKTVARHFNWMRQYGIDGVFLQRFVSGIGQPSVMKHYDRITANVRAGAETYGRAWGMMYDLSGLKVGHAATVIDDWKQLSGRDHITQDKQYIHQNGKPIVVLWGLGFGGEREEKRPNLFEDGIKIIDFLKNDPTYGGNCVMIGVPGQWSQDISRNDDYGKGLERVCEAADIVQPWEVGSCSDIAGVQHNKQTRWIPDVEWCRAHERMYMPVVFPGFTWHNLRHGKTPSDQIPRDGGRLLWAQYLAAKQLNVPFVYQAMFDEVDEGTAIYKVTNSVPAPGKSVFTRLHGLPSDFYLQLVGEATRMIRGEISANQESLIGKYETK